ncbi:MAG: pyridoxine 5'-phosphate synthase [Gemmatimonadetes bacterium]|nr:pyridoxine 5'-phosphate synthase [Gemmatimonadota bacterium]MEE2863382.1 pyridoxine 5'-phosphate synthase [Gemmatimonadota bacterium]|tara:strand:- start:2514 stop:3242 length:729 start_codon:yes stop_codon:yes gene_type:complete
MRLYVNVDHVATVRQARMTDEPDPVRAALMTEEAGADGITVHLREDRRHIQDRDVDLLMKMATTPVNLEVAAVEEMLALACEWRPTQVTIVPEKREEVTTEGGLALCTNEAFKSVADATRHLKQEGIRTSLFVDPDPDVIRVSADLGVEAIELHTGEYANTSNSERMQQLRRLAKAANLARSLGLAVHAGHGLTYDNVTEVAAISELEELNIGHSIISRSVLVGIERAVSEMVDLIRRTRTS